MTGRTGRAFVLVAAVALLCGAGAAWALDLDGLIAKATEGDLELKKLAVSRRMAELDIAQSAAGRGWKLSVAPLSTGLSVSMDPAAATPTLGLAVDPAAYLTMPGPAATSVYVGVPLSLSVPLVAGGSAAFTPSVSAGASQSLNALVGAGKDRKVRELGETMSLLQADAATAARIAAVAEGVIARIKALAELRLAVRDLSEGLLDIAAEAERTKALEALGEQSASYRQLQQRKTGTEESLARTKRAYELRKSRLEKELGVTLGDEPPTVPAASLALPTEADADRNPAVRGASLDVELADARLDQQSQAWLPGLTVGGTVGLSRSSAPTGVALPVSLTMGFSWQVLDSGSRRLARQQLEAQRELRRIALEQARRSYASTLEDLGLDAVGLDGRLAGLERDLEAAKAEVEDTRALVDKGLKTQRDVAKAEFAVEKIGVQLDLLALDRVAFAYRVKTLLLEAPASR